MSNNTYIFMTSLSLGIMIFITRALPFMFSRVLKNSKTLHTIGNYLPAYIMLLLVLYEIKIPTFLHYPYGIPEMIALLLLTLTYLWKKQMLFSMLSGTVVYVILIMIMRS